MVLRALAGVIVYSLTLLGQDEDFRIYRDPPRLLLTPQRAKRLQREPQRESLRWRQFQLLVENKTVFPEPGFAWALHFTASNQPESAKEAIRWALQASASK